ncbi:MAG: hypothetical protein CHACPFDD_02961 [Phycisphaerae bacterium]|nr:hypothetical protein [Phycisphaerae bacterium]
MLKQYGRTILILASVAVVASIACLGLWLFSPARQTFLTDADTIKVVRREARVRDVLWQPPVGLAELINSAGDAYEPRLSWDGLTLYFVRGKAGENAEIFVTARSFAGWSQPEPLAALNSECDELGPEPSADGRTLYFYSDRPGGAGGYDIWVSRRGPDGWQSPQNAGPAVNSEFNDYGPALAPDARTLYFASNRPTPQDVRQPNPDAWPATLREERFVRTYDLYSAELGEAGFAPAAALQALNTPFNEGAPCISPAGDFLYFGSDRPGGLGGYDLYRTRRLRGELRPPENLGASINTAANELDPALTMGGFGLFFSSNRPAERIDAARPNPYRVFHTASREVFSETERSPFDWAAFWRQALPYLLLALLALLLLLAALFFLQAVRDKKLSLLARCLLASLLAHALLLLLFTFWGVAGAIVGAAGRRPPIQVSLASAGAGDIVAQIRGDVTDVAPPAVAATIAAEMPLPEPEAAAPELLVTTPTMQLPDPASPAVTPSVVESAAPPAPLLAAVAPAPPASPSADVALPAERAAIDTAEPVAASPAPMNAVADYDRDHPEVAFSTSQPAARVVAMAPRTAPQSDGPRVDVSLSAAGPADATQSTSSLLPDAAPTVVRARPLTDAALPSESAPPQPAPPESSPAIAASNDVALPHAESLPRDNAPTGVRLATIAPAASELPVVDTRADANALREIRPAEARVELAADVAAPRSASAAARLPSVQPLDRVALPPADEPSADAPAATAASETAELALAARPPESPAAPAPAALAGRERPGLFETRPEPPASVVGVAAALPREIARVRDARGVETRSPSPPTPLTKLAPSQLPAGLALPSETTPPAGAFVQRQPEQREGILKRQGGDDRTERAVASALAWLARQQRPNGGWVSETGADIDTALTGLALLCFLGADHTHAKAGPYQTTVRRGLAALLARQEANGDLRGGETMYSQGIATIALAEALAMTRDAQLQTPVVRAVEFILAGRNQYGGWRYEPGMSGDTSVFGWQVMALKSARVAGVDVPDEVFRTADAWLDRVSSESEPGLYRYRPDRRPTPAMTAEGMFARLLCGALRDESRERAGTALLLQHPPNWEDETNTYYWYYATLTLFHQQGEAWTRWNSHVTRELLAHQESDGRETGSWPPDGEWANVGGRVYQTALCTLMLEVYYRYLPMYAAGR